MRRLARRSSALLAAFISSLLTLLVASITPVWSVFVFSSFESHIHNGVLWESLAWLPHNLAVVNNSEVLSSQLIQENKWNMFLAGVAVVVSLVVALRVF